MHVDVEEGAGDGQVNAPCKGFNSDVPNPKLNVASMTHNTTKAKNPVSEGRR